MPRIISDPLKQGLSSMIYLIAFGGPYSGYKIAEIYYGGKAQTGRIYPILKRLIELKAIKKTNEGYISIITDSVWKDISEDINSVWRYVIYNDEAFNALGTEETRFFKLLLNSRTIHKSNYFNEKSLEKFIGRTSRGTLFEKEPAEHIFSMLRAFSKSAAVFYRTIKEEVDKNGIIDKNWMKLEDYKGVNSFDEVIEKKNKLIEESNIKVDNALMLNSFCTFSCIPAKILGIISPETMGEFFSSSLGSEANLKDIEEGWTHGAWGSKAEVLLPIKKFYDQFFKKLSK